MSSAPSLLVTNLRCEYKVNPLGIDVTRPRLSWQIEAPGRNVIQAAYQIRVAPSADALTSGEDLLWDSGKVASEESIHRVYEGPSLRSGQRCYWQVRVWDRDDRPSDWSEPAFWEMGLLSPEDWQAKWIEPDLDEDTSIPQPCPMLRTAFTVNGAVKSARAYVTSLGLYEMELNGRRVGDQLFTPGWTSYHKRLQYQTYDVTEYLQPGENAIGVTLGDGWYRGYLAFEGKRNTYGEKLALLLQIRIVYEDGRVEMVCSDESWKSSTGPIRMSDIYKGEIYDARLEKPGWSQAGYDDSTWSGVRVVEHSKEILVAPAGPPVRRIQEIRPVEIIRTPAGELVFDMGQNMVGWVRLSVHGDPGTVITLRHAEVLDQEGNLYTENLRSADQTDRYILKGEGEETFEPHFTFHGFRYVAVEGYPGEPTLDDLTGIVIHSDITPTGHFECSHPLINQLQHNIVWGQKGNFLDVPTDCPQRDERLGWTGDAQVFARTACFNMDVAAFFTKWLRDLALDQREDGNVPWVIPNALGPANAGSAAWGDAAAIVPWTIYLCYGDRRILESQYESMKAWVEYIRAQAGDEYLWNTGFHFGDWLSVTSPDARWPNAATDFDLIATAYFAYSTSIVQRTAQILGKEEDAREYADLLAKIRQAFREEFVTGRGRLSPNTQTAYVLALAFDLLSEEQRPEAARRLVEDIRRRDNHLSTGFVGTSYLCHVLSRMGYLDVAYTLLNQETYPSWLYALQWGATTIWERWDGIKPNGEFQDPSMNSFNHYAFGAIGHWLYSVVAGIDVDPDRPGYKHIRIQPHPGGGLTHARATLHSMYGPIESSWELTEDRFHLSVSIPANTHATVRLPHAILEQVTESGRPLREAEGITRAKQTQDAVLVEIGSGRYDFVYEASALREAAKEAAQLSIHSPLRELLADERARKILAKYVSDAIDTAPLEQIMDLSLAQLADYAPRALTDEVLQAIEAELIQR
ncbi:MAG: family 78 glycoside hydrolase catalytic domain [Chloroflexi bacterium]|nr:family 78 glycoside hydrolase catalytic domain [Chloroflexota bacterium]